MAKLSFIPVKLIIYTIFNCIQIFENKKNFDCKYNSNIYNFYDPHCVISCWQMRQKLGRAKKTSHKLQPVYKETVTLSFLLFELFFPTRCICKPCTLILNYTFASPIKPIAVYTESTGPPISVYNHLSIKTLVNIHLLQVFVFVSISNQKLI